MSTRAYCSSSRSPTPYAVEQVRHLLGDPVADAKVHVGIERGDDLFGVKCDAVLDYGLGDVVFVGMGLDRRPHLGIEDQAVDEHLTFGQLKRANLDIQAGAYFVEHLIDAPSQKPSRAGDQNPIQQPHERQSSDQNEKPEGDGDVTPHALLPD